MSSTNLIPVFTPEGNLAKIPAENISEAMKPENGFKMAVSLTSPEGNAAWVPNDKAHDALAQGFKLGPPEQQKLGEDYTSRPELSGAELQTVRTANDNRPLWRKALGLQSTDPTAQAAENRVSPGIQGGMAQQLSEDPRTSVARGATTAVKGFAVDTPKAVYHAVADDPSNSEEQSMDVLSGRLGLAGHRLIDNPMEAERQKATLNMQQGHTSEALAHSVAGSIPGMGPLAAHFGEAIGQDPVAGVTEGLATLALPKAAGEAAKAIKGIPAVKGALNAASDALDVSAKADLGKVLAPTKQATKFISREKVIPGMQERGITAATAKGLQDTAAGKMEELGQKIDDAYDAQPVQPNIPIRPIIDKLEAYKKNFVNDVPALGNQPAKSVVMDQEAIDRIQNVQDKIAEHGDALDPQSMRNLRQYLDRNVAAGKGYAGKTMAEGHLLEIQKQAANAIRGQLADSVPGLGDINSEFSFWKNLHDVMEETAQRRTGQQGGGLGRKIATGTGTAVGAHLGGPAGALIGAETGNFISRLANSTAWNTISAKLKTGLADALATKDPAAINQAVTAIQNQPQIKGLLGKGATITPPPVDTIGSVPFTPPLVTATSRAQRMGLLLPEKATPESIPLQTSSAPTSQEGLLSAARRTVRDPSTGRMKVQFLTGPAEQAPTRPAFLRGSQQAVDATAAQPRSLSDTMKASPERRQAGGSELRAILEDAKSKLSPEESTNAIFTDEKSGMPNAKAFNIAQPQLAATHPHVGFADIDGFKDVNTQLGEPTVDETVFPAVGDAMRSAIAQENGAVHGFHVHGDEFQFLGSDPAAISRVVDRVNGQLANAKFTVKKPDGTISEVPGVGFSHGTGDTLEAANAAEKIDKQARKAAGLRTGSRDTPQNSTPQISAGQQTTVNPNAQRTSVRGTPDQQNPVNPRSLSDIISNKKPPKKGGR